MIKNFQKGSSGIEFTIYLAMILMLVAAFLFDLELINFESELHFDAAKEHIDHLQKRLDEINNHLEINYDENRGDDSHSYWSGYNQALRELFEILKGEKTK